MTIKHVTIDFWGTIFKSNPDYAVARDKAVFDYLADKGHLKGITLLYLEEAYKFIKEFCNASELATGLAIPLVAKHHMFFNKLNVPISEVNAEYFQLINDLFKQYPLTPLHPDVLEIIQALSDKYLVGILSNSGMVPSEMIHDLLDNGDDIHEHYTDNIRYCKPDSRFFGAYAASVVKNDAYSQWLHIGDMDEFDIKPIKAFGGRGFKISGASDWDNLKTLLL